MCRVPECTLVDDDFTGVRPLSGKRTVDLVSIFLGARGSEPSRLSGLCQDGIFGKDTGQLALDKPFDQDTIWHSMTSTLISQPAGK
jgi:hypothetical protein